MSAVGDTFEFSKENKLFVAKLFKKADHILQEEQNGDQNFKDKFDEGDLIKPELISDTVIIERQNDKQDLERPIIDLVQQGGGMWGIALLGYCYILEKVGIRFYSHGGTSAGAINAMLLSSITPDIYKEKPISGHTGISHSLKSELLSLLTFQKDFKEFMSRKGIIKIIQKLLFKNINNYKILLVSILLIFVLGLILHIFMLSFYLNPENGLGFQDYLLFYTSLGVFYSFIFILFIYILISKALGNRFGLNTGDEFYIWIKKIQHKLGVNTTEDLYRNMAKVKLAIPKNDKDVKNESLKTQSLRHFKTSILENDEKITKNYAVYTANVSDEDLLQEFENDNQLENPKLVVISSNISHHRIVRFPLGAKHYWENPEFVSPAAYVRASMSLPFIFDTFCPQIQHYADKHYHSPNHILDKKNKKIKLKANFIDGGMLSNFPIREFHREGDNKPRYPTFGVLLSDKTKNENSKKNISLFEFLGSFIETFKHFYDKDYLNQNQSLQNQIEYIDTSGINWIDFWMPPEDKQKLFIKGVEAGIRQLKKFDWEAYKENYENKDY